MSATDPRVLVPMLEDLQRGLERGMLECRASVAESIQTQRYLAEHGVRMATRVRFLESLVGDDEQRTKETLLAVEAAEARTEDALTRTTHVLSQSRRISAKSHQTHDHWRAQIERAKRRLSAAQAWVSRAVAAVAVSTARVNNASAALDVARARVIDAANHVSLCEQRVSSAYSQLSAAQANLSQCLQPIYYTDSEGRQQVGQRDCSNCHAAVAQASQSLASAKAELRAAEQQLNYARQQRTLAEQELSAAESQLAVALVDLANARSELAAAESDLRLCQANLAKAEEAVRLAKAAVVQATHAAATAAEASEAIGASRIPAEHAWKVNLMQRRRCEQLDVLARQVYDSLQLGEDEVRKAGFADNSVANTVWACNNDLSLRVDHLRTLDRSYDFN